MNSLKYWELPLAVRTPVRPEEGDDNLAFEAVSRRKRLAEVLVDVKYGKRLSLKTQ